MQKTFKLVSNEINKLAKVDIRFLFLIGLLIFLPALEAPKNIFAFLFVVSWVVIAKKNIVVCLLESAYYCIMSSIQLTKGCKRVA